MLPPLNFNTPPNTPAVISNLNRRRRRPVHRPTLAAADALAASGVFPTRPRFSSSSSSSASAGARRGQGRRPRLRPRRSWAGLGCRARHCHRESATPLLLLPRLRCLGSSASPAVCGTCSSLAASRSAGPSYQARRRGAVAGLHLPVQHRPEGKQEQQLLLACCCVAVWRRARRLQRPAGPLALEAGKRDGVWRWRWFHAQERPCKVCGSNPNH